MVEIIKFIFNPKETIDKDNSFYQTILRFAILFVLCFFLSVVSLFITEFLRNFGIIPEYTRDLGTKTESIRGNILYAAILFPLIEEIAFRLYLIRNQLNVFVSSFFMTYMIISNFIFRTSSFSLTEHGLIRVCSAITVAAFILYLYRRKRIKVKFNILFYFSALIFGLVHIYNYDYTNPHVIVFAIVICLPQIISGLLLGYSRVKYGIFGSIFLHALINGIPMILIK